MPVRLIAGVDAAPDVLNVHEPVIFGVMACDNAGAASDRMKVVALPFTAVNPIVAEGSAAGI